MRYAAIGVSLGFCMSSLVILALSGRFGATPHDAVCAVCTALIGIALAVLANTGR